MADLNERQQAFLRVLARAVRPMGSGAVFNRAFPNAPYRGRRDAGATRTLDALERLGYVSGHYPYSAAFGYHSGGRDWEITEEGREALKASG